MTKWLMICLSIIIITGVNGCSQPKTDQTIIDLSAQEKQPVPDELVRAGQFLNEGKPGEAARISRKWEKKNKNSVWIDHAIYYQARGNFQTQKYYRSFKYYEKLLDQYVSSKFYEQSLFEEVDLAEIFLGGWKRHVLGLIILPTRLEGIKILERTEQRWPGSELASRALLMQAEHYYNRKMYIEAQQTCHIIIENYPRCKEYQRAMYLVAEASYAQFQGILYDTGCLDEALIRYEQYKLEFPKQAVDLQVDNRIDAIHAYQALKDFEVVDFYIRTHKIEAACHQLKAIQVRWSGTEWENRARTLLIELNPENELNVK